MFPPRTEAPTADKLTLCYAPHVDMGAVMEIEVRFYTRIQSCYLCCVFFVSSQR